MLYFHIMIANRKFILFYFLTVPASITNGGATNVKGIRIQCSSKLAKSTTKEENQVYNAMIGFLKLITERIAHFNA